MQQMLLALPPALRALLDFLRIIATDIRASLNKRIRDVTSLSERLLPTKQPCFRSQTPEVMLLMSAQN